MKRLGLILLVVLLSGCAAVSASIPQGVKDAVAYTLFAPIVGFVYATEFLFATDHPTYFTGPTPSVRVDIYDAHSNRIGYAIAR